MATSCARPSSPPPRVRASKVETRPRFRYFVHCCLLGGLDSIYTTNPKRSADVESWVPVPYSPNEIVSTPTGYLAPAYAPLAPISNRLAILQNVAVQTVSHEYGKRQFFRARHDINQQVPWLADIVGESIRDTQAVSLLLIGSSGGTPDTSPGLVTAFRANNSGLLKSIEALNEEEALVLARSLRDVAQRNVGRTASSYAQAAALIERVRRAPRFKPEPWVEGLDKKTTEVQTSLQQAVWAIQNDIAASVALFSEPLVVDSHANNDAVQSRDNLQFAKIFARFIQELERRKNVHGSLIDQTLGVFGSELGRFPRLNDRLGKDHWPEAPSVLFGGSVKPGIYGDTDRRMAAVPVDMRTGLPDRNGEYLDLEHVGSTVLTAAGLPGAPYGYSRPGLSFALRSS